LQPQHIPGFSPSTPYQELTNAFLSIPMVLRQDWARYLKLAIKGFALDLKRKHSRRKSRRTHLRYKPPDVNPIALSEVPAYKLADPPTCSSGHSLRLRAFIYFAPGVLLLALASSLTPGVALSLADIGRSEYSGKAFKNRKQAHHCTHGEVFEADTVCFLFQCSLWRLDTYLAGGVEES